MLCFPGLFRERKSICIHVIWCFLLGKERENMSFAWACWVMKFEAAPLSLLLGWSHQCECSDIDTEYASHWWQTASWYSLADVMSTVLGLIGIFSVFIRMTLKKILTVDSWSCKGKVPNPGTWFSGCQRVGLAVMGNGAASAFLVHWGFWSTKTSKSKQNTSLYNPWTGRSHAVEAMVLSAVVPVSTAVQQPCGSQDPRSVEQDGNCPCWRSCSIAANSIPFEEGLTCIWTGEPKSAGLPLGELEIAAGCVNIVHCPIDTSFLGHLLSAAETEAELVQMLLLRLYLAGFLEAFKGRVVWHLPDIFWTNSLKDWRSCLDLN